MSTKYFVHNVRNVFLGVTSKKQYRHVLSTIVPYNRVKAYFRVVIPVPINGDIPGTDGSGLAHTLLDALSVPIGLKDGLSPDSTTEPLPGASDVPMGEELGDVDVEGVVVGTGEPEVLGGEDDAAS